MSDASGAREPLLLGPRGGAAARAAPRGAAALAAPRDASPLRRVRFADDAAGETPEEAAAADAASASASASARPALQRLFNSRKLHRTTVELTGIVGKRRLYFSDAFHTLVNMRAPAFLALFLATYLAMYSAYAALYLAAPRRCLSGVQTFSHAFWFSVHTSAAIGYGRQSPEPDCFALNAAITGQVLTTALMQAALLGLVYARFASPARARSTIRFSRALAAGRDPRDGAWRLAFRVASLRRHQVLRPEVHMLMVSREETPGTGALEWRYRELALEHVTGAGTRLWLGVPSVLAHRVDARSPLWGWTRARLEASGAEFLVMLDGVNEATSSAMQARKSYLAAADIRWHASFVGVLARSASSGALAADYTALDSMRVDAAAGDEEAGGGEVRLGGGPAGAGADGPVPATAGGVPDARGAGAAGAAAAGGGGGGT